MKRIKQLLAVLLVLLSCSPMTALASGTTDIYVGVTTVTKSNMRFYIVDEEAQPIDGASIELWANDQLLYELLGVSHDGGIYETTLPYGDYPYKVYLTGYETVEEVLHLPNKENPHIETVVLKKKQPESSSGEGNTETNTGTNTSTNTDTHTRNAKTGDADSIWLYLSIMAGAAVLLIGRIGTIFGRKYR